MDSVTRFFYLKDIFTIHKNITDYERNNQLEYIFYL